MKGSLDEVQPVPPRSDGLLTLEEVVAVRQLVRAHLREKPSPSSIERMSKSLCERMRQSSGCRADISARILDVVRIASVTSAASVNAGGRSLPSSSASLAKRLQVSRGRARLSRLLHKWRAAGSHHAELARNFRKLCWQEALKTTHLQLASSGGAISTEEKQYHRFQARVADVRAEMQADLCIQQPDSVDIDELKDSGADKNVVQWRGVNLGGWLLWEPGPADKSPLVASLGCDAKVPKDEWTLCEQLIATHGRERAKALLHEHRSTHVTRADFEAIKNLGMNAVRVPFGYWAFLGERDGEPFMGPCAEFLDNALSWGEELGLSIVLCFHSAVGFQSYDAPCGRSNWLGWKPSQFDVEASVGVLRQLVQRYRSHPALGAVCVLNEPHGAIPAAKMNRFFKAAYAVMRDEECLPESVQIMLPIFHHDVKDFAKTYRQQNGYLNVVFDVHIYQVFGDPYAGWRKMSLAQHLRFAAASSHDHVAKQLAQLGERAVVTEFSLGLPTWHHSCSIHWELASLSSAEQNMLHCSFMARQLRTFAKYTEGWFFWSWKDDSGPAWAFSEAAARGWIPLGRNKSATSDATSKSDDTSDDTLSATSDDEARATSDATSTHLKKADISVGDKRLGSHCSPPAKRFRAVELLESVDVGFDRGVSGR